MLDTHAIARSLTGSGLSDAQADAITAAFRLYLGADRRENPTC